MERWCWWCHGGLVVTLCAASACGDDAPSADTEESSAGTEDPTTDMPTSTGSGDPDSSGIDTSSSSSDGSSSSDSTTGEELPMPTDARVFYTVTSGTPEQNGTWLVDVLAGELGEPVRVSDDVAYPVSSSPSRRWMADDGPPVTPGVRLLDRDAVPIAPAHIIELDDVSGFEMIYSSPTYASDETAIAIIASGKDIRGLFTLTLDDAGPGVPWRADTGLPGSTYVEQATYLAGDAQLVLVTHDETTNTEALVLGPANADAPGDIVPIATTVAGEQMEHTGMTTDGTLLAYRVRTDDVGRGYVVDIANLPAASIELVRPAPDTRITSLQIAPDDSGIAYAVRVPMDPVDESSLWWSALENGAPQPPVEVTADYPQVYGVGAWSADARWMALRVDSEPIRRLLVRIEDGVPSSPFDLGPIVDSLADTSRSFTSDGWFYYLTEIDGGQAVLRVDVTGDTPGAPQTVIGPVGDVIEYEISADASTLVINTADMFAGDYEGFAIDLTGSEPGEPVRINAPMAPGEWVYRIGVTPNGRGIVYERRTADASSRHAHYVDVATPGMALTLADGVDINGVSVRALP